ncbi:MAG: protein kinase [Candidatus Pacearchaeota archaeon]|nr:protein kinase [Candidatus Pacearchaeota archaeon]
MASPEHIGRFAREIKTLTKVDHEHVIHIYQDNLDTEKNYPAFIMDLAEMDLVTYITKTSSKNNLNDRPVLGTSEAKLIYISMLNAVEALHQSSPPIIHRDINPNNILKLFDGDWVLADFSLAKFLPPSPASTTFATKTHAAGIGTAHYTPPEQYKSLKDADTRSDIYSMGWLLWELFSQEGPYPRPDPSGLPSELEVIFHKAINHDKQDRYQTISELKQAVELALEGLKD